MTITTPYKDAISNKVLNIPGMKITFIRIRMLLCDCIMEFILNCIGYIVYFVIVYTGSIHTIQEWQFKSTAHQRKLYIFSAKGMGKTWGNI